MTTRSPRSAGAILAVLLAWVSREVVLLAPRLRARQPARRGARGSRSNELSTRALDATECLVVVTELGTGTVVSLNQAARDLTGYTADDVVGEALWDRLVPPADRAQLRASYGDPSGDAIALAYEGSLVTKAGAERRVAWSSAFITGADGVRTHVVMSGVDLSLESNASGLFSQLILVAASSATGSVGVDLQGRVTYWSSAAEQMLGYSGAELIGRDFPLVMFDPDELQARASRLGRTPDLCLFAPADESSTGSDPPSERWTMNHKDGSRIAVSIKVTPVRDACGKTIGFLGLGSDVTAERRTHDLLVAALEREAAAGERLRELERTKAALVGTVSHELRTPLTSITGYTELLQDGAGGQLNSVQRGQVDAIHRSTERLTCLVEDLLSLSSIESGTFQPDQAELDLRDCLCRAIELLAPVLSSRRLTMSYTAPPCPVLVVGDAGHLERAALNLLTNAVKFTDDGGSVSCAITQDSDRAILKVTDTGLGIPAEEQGSLFQRFFRSSTAQHRQIPGSGLGLAIVAAVVHSHGGEIRATSEHLQGSEFTIELPLSRAGALPAAS